MAEIILESTPDYDVVKTTSKAGFTIETRYKEGSEGLREQERERGLAALRAKAEAVAGGRATFTAAEIQRLLAGLVLR